MKQLYIIYVLFFTYPLIAADHKDYFALGNQEFKNGNYEKSIEHFQQALAINPRSSHAYFNMAIAYEQNNDIDSAIQAYRNAIQLKPNYAKAHEQLGKRLQEKGKDKEQVIECFSRAVAYDPSKTDLALELARLYVDQEKFSDSLKYYDLALQAKSDDVIIRFEYANALNTSHETEKALEHYLQLLKQRPNDSSILYNTAYTYKKLGRLKEAMPYYDAALKKKPDHAEAHFSLGLAHLIEGDFDKGWPKYEWRWQRGTQLSPRDLKQPQWDGSQLNGKKILLHAEQGLGDTFQFIRYAKVVKEQYGGEVIVAVQSPLHVFAIRCCPYIDKVIPLSHIYTEECDVQIPLMTLPLLFKTNESNMPTDIPYLKPEPALVTYWGQKLAADKNFKIGICWQGNSKYSSPFLRSVVAAKSIALEKFKPLLQTPGVSFYSLQKENGEDQLKELADLNIKIFDADFDNKHGRFMDTAAVIEHLDLVITIDTSISHLSAALGKPVWIMIPEPPDWRWMLTRDDTPWYPNNMRLFRQPTQGNWDAVIATITQELHSVLTTNAPLITHRHKGAGIKNKNNISPVLEKRKTPIIQTSNCSSTHTQLHQELDSVNKKMALLSQAIKNSDASPDDELFMKNMRNFYMLSEIRSQLQAKLSALEGI